MPRARERFGYARDTLIGPLPQPNPESDRWVPFFRDHRLLFMARRAHEEGALPPALLGRIERLAARIGDYLIEPAHPSLLHGDLWTGNVLVRQGRIAGLVDPAISCGHPEIELAFATLFGTFGRSFFETYESLLPLEPGFHELRSSSTIFIPGWCMSGCSARAISAASTRTLDAARDLAGRLPANRDNQPRKYRQKRTGPDEPGRSSLRNEPSSKGMALLAGWLAPPSLFLSR